MGCYWYQNGLCADNIIVRRENARAFEKAVEDFGLWWSKHEWEELPDGNMRYVNADFVCGDGVFDYADTVQEEIMSITEPGSYVDFISDEDTSSVIRCYHDDWEYGEIDVVFSREV